MSALAKIKKRIKGLGVVEKDGFNNTYIFDYVNNNFIFMREDLEVVKRFNDLGLFLDYLMFGEIYD
jgi:hypothetical protein